MKNIYFILLNKLFLKQLIYLYSSKYYDQGMYPDASSSHLNFRESVLIYTRLIKFLGNNLGPNDKMHTISEN